MFLEKFILYLSYLISLSLLNTLSRDLPKLKHQDLSARNFLQFYKMCKPNKQATYRESSPFGRMICSAGESVTDLKKIKKIKLQSLFLSPSNRKRERPSDVKEGSYVL